MKDQLEKCVNGYYEANGIEELNCIKMEKENEEVKRPSKAKLIGVCGACKRIGTTTHAVQIVRYLQLNIGFSKFAKNVLLIFTKNSSKYHRYISYFAKKVS